MPDKDTFPNTDNILQIWRKVHFGNCLRVTNENLKDANLYLFFQVNMNVTYTNTQAAKQLSKHHTQCQLVKVDSNGIRVNFYKLTSLGISSLYYSKRLRIISQLTLS